MDMTTETEQFTGRVIGRLCAILAKRSQLGVMAEGLPPLDVEALIDGVATVAEELDWDGLRLAVLGATKRVPRRRSRVELSWDPLVANQWRNDEATRSGVRSIVVVLGPATKLNSLRTALRPIQTKDVRAELVKIANGWFSQPERRYFWSALAQRQRDLPTAKFFEYAAAVAPNAKKPAQLLEVELAEVWRLGMLRSTKLTSSSGAGGAKSAIRSNLELVRNLQEPSDAVRERLVALSESGDPEQQRAADQVLSFMSSGAHDKLRGLTLEGVHGLLRAEAPTKGKTSGDGIRAPKKERVEGDVLAVDLLMEGGKGIKKAASEFADVLEPSSDVDAEVDEISVSGRVVLAQPREGSRQSLGLFASLIDEHRWGGVVVAPEAKDLVGATKMVASGDAQLHPFIPADKEHVRGMLEKAVDRRMIDRSALESFDRYAALRAKILPRQTALLDHPLLALGADRQLAACVKELLTAYDELLAVVKVTGDVLQQQGSLDPSRRLIARMMCLDLVFVHDEQEWVAVAAPTHPFHLWRIHALIEVFDAHIDELRMIGRSEIEDCIADPHTTMPHVVLSRYAVDEVALSGTLTLTAAGSFGALPMFAEPSARQAGRFRSTALPKLAERLMRLMPHSAVGLRVALIDPPSVAGALEKLQSLTNPFDDEAPVPLHVSIHRTRRTPEATDEEDEKLSNLGREIVDAGGTLQVHPTALPLRDIAAHLQRRPVHLTAIFDPGRAEIIKLSAPRPRLSPLAVPRTYQYDGFDDRIDVVISGDIPMFGSYHELFSRTIDAPTTDILGCRSGASQTTADLERLAPATIWMSVIDQGIEPTFRIRGAERLDWRQDAGRDVVTVTAHRETVEHLVRDALRLAGLPATEESVKTTLGELFNLSGEAILGLLRAQIDVSLVEPRFAKGLIGALIAVRWYLRTYPHALIISLDEPTSRRWILGAASDDRRGDLLAVRSGEAGPVLEAIEVKTYGDPQGVVQVRGKTIEGEAVTQIDQTLHILDGIVGASDSAVAQARESILKDQLYRAVAARPYPADQRARLVRTLEELFGAGDGKGPSEVSGLVFSVKLAPGDARVWPEAPVYYRSSAQNKIGLIEIVECGEDIVRYEARSMGTSVAEESPARPYPSASQVGRPSTTEDAPSANKRSKKTSKRDATVAGDHELRVAIGDSPSGSPVFWAPHDTDCPLNNFGVLVTGDSGAGKTQILRAIIHEVAMAGIPICAFDYKNDYAAPEFSKAAGLEVHDVSHDGLPFNPLELVFGDGGKVQPIRHIHELAGILKRVFGLGDQMNARLRKAMTAAYEAYGMGAKDWIEATDERVAPSFDDVIAVLERDPKNEKLLNRLAPLFDLGLFPSSESAGTTFEEMLERKVVLLMNGLDQESKQAISEFIIVRLHAHALRGEQPRRLRRLLVFDEAWRIKDSERLHDLAREGRAFGIGIALGTQFPGDLPDTLTGNLATQLFLLNQSSDHRRSVIRTLLGTSTGGTAKGLELQLQRLQKHEGFFRNQQYAPYTFVTTTPHYKR
jgi:hypothetical protein